MNDWKQKMVTLLESGQQPSKDDLEEALAGSIAERNDLATKLKVAATQNVLYEAAVADLSGWLGKLSGAFLRGDADKLAETMNDFVNQRVKAVMPDTKKPPH